MKALKNTIAEMGVSIGCYSAATLTLGTVTLIGSLAFQGVIWVGNGLERIEKSVQRVGIMSGLIIGASAVGYILGAAMSGVGTREDLAQVLVEKAGAIYCGKDEDFIPCSFLTSLYTSVYIKYTSSRIRFKRLTPKSLARAFAPKSPKQNRHIRTFEKWNSSPQSMKFCCLHSYSWLFSASYAASFRAPATLAPLFSH